MNILVVGAGTSNKGAYLMLHAVKQQAEKYMENATLVISPCIGDTIELESIGYKRLNFPLFHVSSPKWIERGIKYPKLTQIAYKIIKKSDYYGVIEIDDIDLVLDISGFAFSDQFGPQPLIGLELIASFFRKNSVPYIMFPQALGPFIENASLARSALSKVSLIYSRDSSSYFNAKEVLKENLNILSKCSDITLTLETDANIPKEIFEIGKYCTIVPNQKMVEKARKSWKENYEKAISESIYLILKDSELDILLLVHNGVKSKDFEIADRIYQKFYDNTRVHFYQHDDPLVLKQILKKSIFLIGSRFHSLASALSSNTPCVSTSWAHKYEELFKEYEIEEYSHLEYDSDFYKSVKRCLVEENRIQTVKKLQRINESIGIQNEQLWTSVKKLLE